MMVAEFVFSGEPAVKLQGRAGKAVLKVLLSFRLSSKQPEASTQNPKHDCFKDLK